MQQQLTLIFYLHISTRLRP